MEKEKEYRRIRFSAEVLQAAARKLEERMDPKDKKNRDSSLWAELGNESWRYDSEIEFFADFRRSPNSARYGCSFGYGKGLKVNMWKDYTIVEVHAPTREDIEAVFEIFERAVDDSRLPEPDPEPPKEPIIFIGHGHSAQWRDLKDHLHDKHHFKVSAYEIGARAGHAVRDILDELLKESSISFLVLTAEDESVTGIMRARQNVIHEAGLFQGRLGFHRGIIVLEEGTDDFSNISGIEQIRYSAGNIKETFGEVVATIRREFPGHTNS